MKELGNTDNLPQPVALSADLVSQSIVQNSQRILNQLSQSGIDDSTSTAGTAITTMSGVLASGASGAYPPNAYPTAYLGLKRVIDQRSQQEEIAGRLAQLDTSIADEYNNAWQNLYIATRDKTRSPMFLIREVYTRLLHRFAPDEEVIRLLNLTDKSNITRSHRIEYIASLLAPWKRETLLKEKEAFLNIYKSLNKAHKHGTLNVEQTKSFLYQANGLIKLLLDSLGG